MRLACIALASLLAYGCAGLMASGPPVPMRPGVVQFDLSQVDPQGNRPNAGFKPLTYAFCVPNNPDATGGIQSIDRTARCYPGVPGPISCRPDQALCLGNTGQPNWAGVLAQLSNEPFVRHIYDTGMPTPPRD